MMISIAPHASRLSFPLALLRQQTRKQLRLESVAQEGRAKDDAVAALVGLGFRPADAMGAISQAASRLGGEAGVEALIRDGLAHLAPREHGP